MSFLTTFKQRLLWYVAPKVRELYLKELRAMSTAENTGVGSQPDRDAIQNQITSQDDERIALANNLEGLLPQQSLHSFGGDKANVWKMMAKGQNGSSPGKELSPDATIALQHYYMHRVTLVNAKTGEITTPIRTVLYDANGDMWHFVSDGIANAVAQMIQAFGTGEFNPPVNVKVKKITTRSGMSTMSLIPAE